ncbi:MAG: polysaccharide deacetylase family protein [Clostridia bacterium]|nr:polysaccharide deacetylase family protein [Clostridia bacterium]
MRFASVFITFIAALTSLLLIFGCFKEKTAIENIGGFEDVVQKTEDYRQEIEDLKQELQNLTNKKTEAEGALAILESRENYKTTPTAFLTFDGGFSQNTVDVIETLNKNELKGTFFVVGTNLKTSENLRNALKSAWETGHKIGIRSYSDDLKKIYSGENAYFEDLYAIRDLVKEITGESPILVRMPGGTATAEVLFERYTGSKDVFPKVLARLEAEGFMVNDWSVDSKNATNTDVDEIVSTTLNGSSRTLKATYKTCVVLFTDNKRANTSLPRIIAGLKDQGYTFASLPTGICITRQR